jgi:hypothetical protein
MFPRRERQTMRMACRLAVLACVGGEAVWAAEEPLPFNHKVEVYRNQKQGVTVFALRLEQPFLAEEFEASNYLRLEPTDDKAYLIYPKEGRFQQKHAPPSVHDIRESERTGDSKIPTLQHMARKWHWIRAKRS